ncbi:hypothetical protein [Ornithinibacillus contaminans]|uniref:hypothetical protein n=1 Tax=Ornithinibacillus contaminans TaxID=694055 RepID=UPI00064DDD67|nr:hypothetical protein [Ornithinibacillus contaminans]
MKNKFNPILALFSGVQIVLSMIFIFAMAAVYNYFVLDNVVVSVIIGFITMLVGFYNIVYIPRKLKKERYLLNELQKYATNMTFYMQSGYNIINSLKASKRDLDKEIKKDIDLTIEGLEKDAVLRTVHFNKYNFPAIDIFHQILQVKYDVGGNSKSLFSKANKNINFELVKRDELYRRKRQFKNKIMVMMGMSLVIPLMLRFTAGELYAAFLSLGYLAIGLNVVLFIANLISMNFLQKALADLNIIN